MLRTTLSTALILLLIAGIGAAHAGTRAMAAADGNTQTVQFEIQVATSDLQNAENVRSQAEKRLEQQRKDLTRNWGG
jgi:hypothetical protein